MSFIRTEKNQNYSTISNVFIRDKNLSWGAKGLLVYLLHLPDNWQIKIEHLRYQAKDGKDYINSRIKELIAAGYIEKEKQKKGKGKFEGCNYVVREIPNKKEAKNRDGFTVTEPPSRNHRHGTTVTADPSLINTNKINTNKINTNKINTNINNISVSKETHLLQDNNINLPARENNNSCKINKNCLQAITMLKDIGFSVRLPESGKPLTKTLLRVQNHLYNMSRGRFLSEIKLDPEWREKNNIQGISPNGGGFDDIVSMLKKAGKRYQKMRTDSSIWPEKKERLTNSIENWLYNPRTGKSMFLYCLFNRPKPLKSHLAQINADKIFPDTFEGKKERKFAEQFKFETWNEMEYWSRVKDMYEWGNTFCEALQFHNENWNVFRDFIDLLDLMGQFRDTWQNSWKLGHFGRGTKTWQLFVAWVKENRGFDLEPEISSLLVSVNYWERQGRMIKNSNIIRDMESANNGR